MYLPSASYIEAEAKRERLRRLTRAGWKGATRRPGPRPSRPRRPLPTTGHLVMRGRW